MVSEDRKAASAQRRARNRAHGEAMPDGRVRAKPIEPGAKVKITRRCLEQRMFLSTGKNEDEIRNYYAYTLGVGLMRYQHDLHAACQMGNHHHVDITDRLGLRPEFKTSVHGNLSRGLNAKRGRFDTFWDGSGSCDTKAPTDEESLQDLVYTDTNPVKHGLVKWGHLWPGFTTYGWRFGETRTFKRPDWYHDPDNPNNPDEVQITRVRPEIFKDLTDDELSDLLMERCRERERKIQAEMRQKGRRFAGVKKLRKQHWNSQAQTPPDKFGVRPRVASSCRFKMLAQLQRDRAWEAEYAAARAELQKGGSPTFPYGTYKLRRDCGVKVAQAPP